MLRENLVAWRTMEGGDSKGGWHKRSRCFGIGLIAVALLGISGEELHAQFNGEVLRGSVEHDGHTYALYQRQAAFSRKNALLFCKEVGKGDLVSVGSSAEDAAVSKLLKLINGPVWTGGYRDVSEKKWKWTDGTVFQFHHFPEGVENRTDFRNGNIFVNISSTGSWLLKQQRPRAKIHALICEWPTIVTPPEGDDGKSTAKEPDPGPTRMVKISGNANAAEIALKANQSGVSGLLVVDLGGGKYAGKASKMTVIALPSTAGEPASVGFNQEVGETMETALVEVLKFLQLRHDGWPKGKAIEISFQENFSPKDGPSAGVACALLLESLINGDKLDENFAVTGRLNVDGSVQPIGGVTAKVSGATVGGRSTVAVPSANVSSLYDLLLSDGLKPFLGAQVFSLENFEDAFALAQEERSADLQLAIAEFALVQELFGFGESTDLARLRNSNVQQKLRKVIEVAPNHLSAKILILATQNQAPKKFSLAGSVDEIDEAGSALVDAVKAGKKSSYTGLNKDHLADGLSSLQRIRSKLDDLTWPYADALVQFGNVLRQLPNRTTMSKSAYEKLVAEINASVDQVNAERERLLSMPEVVELLIK